MIFWAAPTMSVSHLLFAVVTTVYIVMAIRFEERDLVSAFGEQYTRYRASTPMLVPRLSIERTPVVERKNQAQI
jgi:protein-S-isoprenylcysteine O-methyltransferase Ste14